MTPARVARHALDALGGDRVAAKLATAVAMAENRDLDPSAHGDQHLADDKWDDSIGLWQIRGLRSHRGTGKHRDATKLEDPAFNAESMAVISGGGRDWTAWTMFRNGEYRAHLDAAEAAVAQASGQPTEPIPDSGGGVGIPGPADAGSAAVGVLGRAAMFAGGALLAAVGLGLTGLDTVLSNTARSAARPITNPGGES